MLLIVYNKQVFHTSISSPSSSRPPSLPLLFALSRATKFNLFCCAFVCKPGIAQGWGVETVVDYTQRRDPEHKLHHLIMAVFTAPTPKWLVLTRTSLGHREWLLWGVQLACQKTQKKDKKSERWRIMAPISFECCYNNTVYSRAPVYIVIMHSEVWIPTHVMHTYTNKTRTNTRSLVFYEYSTCAYMDAIPCATLFQGFNIYPLVFRRVLCWKDIFMLLISCNHVFVFCFYTTAFFLFWFILSKL